jgi:TP901 family phage tail tape measure protein
MRAGVRAQAALAKAGRGGLGAGAGGATGAGEQAERRYTRAVEAESAKRLRSFRAEARMRRQVLGEEERDLLKSVRAEEKARERANRNAARMARAQSRELDRFATRTSHRATRFLWPNAPLASMGRRAGADIMRGLGVDTSLAGTIGRGRDLERSATALSTAGYISGAPDAAGQRVKASDLMGEARKVGDQFSIDPQSVIDAQDQFVKLTGDLDTARSSMGAMASLAIASGTDLTDMATAAGEVSNALGDVPNKAAEVEDVLRSLAAQGKIGSVEIRDYAKYMAHLGGTAGSFGAKRSQTIKEFGALVQLAKSVGGATSAATATRSISGLGNTWATPARIAQFKKHGVNLRGKDDMLLSPIELIKEAIRVTGGKTEPMKEMFANVIGAKPATALSNIYKQAGGGEAGMAAVDKELKKQLDASSMNAKSTDNAVNQYKSTTAAKAQAFQNKLDQVADAAMAKLLPALEQLAPVALRVAEGMGTFAQWLAENPGKAVGLAISASIARAGLESAFRTGIERAFKDMTGGAAPGSKNAPPGFLPAGGAISIASSALTIFATAVTLYAAGAALIEGGEEKKRESDKKSYAKDAVIESEAQTVERLQREGASTPEEKAAIENRRTALEERKKELETRVASAEEVGTFGGDWKAIKGWFGMEGGLNDQQIADRAKDATQIAELKAQMERIAQVLAGGIRVTNITDARTPPAGPTVPPDGREPPGGG